MSGQETQTGSMGTGGRVWSCLVRPRGIIADWCPVSIRARSEIQAVAILGRMGLEVAPGSCGPAGEGERPIEDPLRRAVGALACRRCGYGLEGLVVRLGRVECPECSERHTLAVVERVIGVPAKSPRWAAVARNCFAVIGMVAVAIFALSLALSFVALAGF